jgi:hypothetical protein
VIKRLVHRDPVAFGAALGIGISSRARRGYTELNAGAGAVDRRDADLVMIDDDDVVHVEFQTRPDPLMPHRMLVYRGLFMLDPDIRRSSFRQHVVYLTGEDQPTVLPGCSATCAYQVHHAADFDPEPFLKNPMIAPVAVLSARGGREGNLRKTLIVVGKVSGEAECKSLHDEVAALASLVLSQEAIDRVWSEEPRMIEFGDTDVARHFANEGRIDMLIKALARKGVPANWADRIAHVLLDQDPDRALDRAMDDPVEELIALADS